MLGFWILIALDVLQAFALVGTIVYFRRRLKSTGGFVFPKVRAPFPRESINDIVSVQPMTAPTDLPSIPVYHPTPEERKRNALIRRMDEEAVRRGKTYAAVPGTAVAVPWAVLDDLGYAVDHRLRAALDKVGSTLLWYNDIRLLSGSAGFIVLDPVGCVIATDVVRIA